MGRAASKGHDELTARRRFERSPLAHAPAAFDREDRSTARDATRAWCILLDHTVYVRDVEIILGVEGPFLEFRPAYDRTGAVLEVYTSRDRIPGGDPDAEAMPLAVVIRQLPPGVRIRVRGEGGGFVIPTAEIAVLRRVAASREQ